MKPSLQQTRRKKQEKKGLSTMPTWIVDPNDNTTGETV